MEHALAGVGTDVGNHPPSACDRTPDAGRHLEEGGEEISVFGADVGGRNDMPLWDHQYVSRRRRVDVVERQHLIGLDNHVGGNGAGRDRAKQAIRHCDRSRLGRRDAEVGQTPGEVLLRLMQQERQQPQIVATDGEHPPVEVLAHHLDGTEEVFEQLGFPAGE